MDEATREAFESKPEDLEQHSDGSWVLSGRGAWQKLAAQPWARVTVELPDGTSWVDGVEGDQWVTVRPPGWDDRLVRVLAGLRSGRPVILGVQVSGTDQIRQRDWRALNMRSLAEVAMAARGWDLDAYEKAVQVAPTKEPPAPRPRGSRRRASSAEVARLYREALAKGEHPRQYVAKRLGLADRSVDRYLKRARDEGELER